MVSLDDRLREAAAELRSAAAGMPVAPRPSRRPLVLVAAALLLAVLVAAGLAARPDHHAQVVTDDPRPPTTGDVFSSQSEVTTVVHFEGRWFAAGMDFQARGGADGSSPVVWRSDDGERWEVAWRNDGVALGSGALPELFVAGDRLVLISTGTGGTASWQSLDGTIWQPNRRFGTDWFQAGAWFQGRFIAAGTSKTWDMSHDPDLLLALGADGTWVPLETDLPADVRFTALTVHGDELVVAGNLGYPEQAPPLVFHSADGRHWSPATPLDDQPGQVNDLVSDGRTAVAVARRLGGTPQLWVSSDAGTWRHVGDFPPQQDGRVGRVLALDRGYLEVDKGGTLRRSTDGSTWTAIEARIAGIEEPVLAADGTTVVAFERTARGWRGVRIDLGG